MKYIYYSSIALLICSTLLALVGPHQWWKSSETEKWQHYISEEHPMFEIRNRLNESKTFKNGNIVFATAAGVTSEPLSVGQIDEATPGAVITIPGIVTKLAILVTEKNITPGQPLIIHEAKMYQFPAGPTVYIEVKEEKGKIVLKPAAKVSFFKNKTKSGLPLKNNVSTKDIKVRDLTPEERALMQKKYLINLVQHTQTLLEILKQHAAERQKRTE